MTLVRQFEERCLALSRRGLLAGSIHLCIGQEAVAVGAAAALRPDDLTVATYRGHGHVLARGVDPYRALAEVLGRATGLCKGKGGSMHLTDVARGVLPPNSIVGAGLPIATGAALAQLRRGDSAVTLCAFGEGTLNQGAAHEALNLAAIWALPVIFLCENNGYAEMTPAYETIRGDSFGARVAAYGIPTTAVDGMDVGAVADTVGEAVARARRRRSRLRRGRDLPLPGALSGRPRYRLPPRRGGRAVAGARPDPAATSAPGGARGAGCRARRDAGRY